MVNKTGSICGWFIFLYTIGSINYCMFELDSLTIPFDLLRSFSMAFSGIETRKPRTYWENVFEVLDWLEFFSNMLTVQNSSQLLLVLHGEVLVTSVLATIIYRCACIKFNWRIWWSILNLPNGKINNLAKIALCSIYYMHIYRHVTNLIRTLTLQACELLHVLLIFLFK